MFDKNSVLVSSACVFKESKGKAFWFIVKPSKDEEWEIPKVLVRKGESSVRAAIRIIGEKGGMSARVLEEAGRAGGVTTVNGKTIPQRHIYYLLYTKHPSKEAIGFTEFQWLDYSRCLKNLSSKRDKQMLKSARGGFTKWKKENKKKKE